MQHSHPVHHRIQKSSSLSSTFFANNFIVSINCNSINRNMWEKSGVVDVNQQRILGFSTVFFPPTELLSKLNLKHVPLSLSLSLSASFTAWLYRYHLWSEFFSFLNANLFQIIKKIFYAEGFYVKFYKRIQRMAILVRANRLIFHSTRREKIADFHSCLYIPNGRPTLFMWPLILSYSIRNHTNRKHDVYILLIGWWRVCLSTTLADAFIFHYCLLLDVKRKWWIVTCT